MRYLYLIFLTTFLLGFEVTFTEKDKISIFLDKKAILLKTKTPIKIDYSPKIYTEKGILLLNYDNADEFVRNSLYFNGQIKDIKIGILDIDKIRNRIIKKIEKKYQKCNIKKIIFLNSYKKVYFKPTFLDIKSKVILDCK